MGPNERDLSAIRRSPILPIALVVVALLGGGTLFMSGYSMGRQSAVEPGTPAVSSDAFRPFWDTYHTIRGRYAGGPVDQTSLIQGAIRGMIAALGDPYSQYMTSADYQRNLESIGGAFEGIGADLATQSTTGAQGCATLGPVCRLLIVAPIDGSPAQAAGLRAGDLVLGADGVPFDGLSLDSARDRIRGPSGTVVTLMIQRAGDKPFPLRVPRSIVQRPEVVSRSLGGGIGYLKLMGFSDHAATELADSLSTHLGAGRTKIILDLRGNPGGYVTAARSIASDFISRGVLFYEQDASGAQSPSDAIPGGIATDPSIKLVCLIDGGSASASEIVAGALQDTGRATLVGQQSFGKGTVQQWQQLTGEGGAFRLTIARWLTPLQRWINRTGLTPDVPVTIPTGLPATADPTLDRAVEILGGKPA